MTTNKKSDERSPDYIDADTSELVHTTMDQDELQLVIRRF